MNSDDLRGNVAIKQQLEAVLDQVLVKHQALLDPALLAKAYKFHTKDTDVLKEQFLKLLSKDAVAVSSGLTEESQIVSLFDFLERKVDAVVEEVTSC